VKVVFGFVFFHIEHNWAVTHVACILGALAKLRRAIISFFVSVRLSLRMEPLSFHWTDIHEI
jgi:hypothetical protein